MIFALPPLVAEPIFNIGTFVVTNAYINSSIAVFLFLIAGFLLRKQTAMIPKGFQNIAEAILEFMLGYIDRVTHDRKKSLKFLPIVGSLFLFIIISNWMGLIPGTGSIGRHLLVEGHLELVPLFRPANTDLNMTLSMALFAVIASHIIGIVTVGVWNYINKFIKVKDLTHAFTKGPINIFVAITEFGVGLIEIVSEIAKVISLSLRLFGNVFAGEVLLTVLAGLIAYIVPLPFMLLELLVGLIQALVFSMLTLTYLTMATAEAHGRAKEYHMDAVVTESAH